MLKIYTAILVVLFLASASLAHAQTDTTTRTLKEVSITAKKTTVKQMAGKVIYDVQADPESKSNTLIDMIPKIPYLSLDGEGNVLLKGNRDFKVFINGKPSGMFERNLKEVLRGIPASTIQSIEVMTMPPAKYDAEGAGGIINIITLKKGKDQYSGNLNMNNRWPAGGTAAGGSFTYQKDKFGISSFAGGGSYHNPEIESNNERIAAGQRLAQQAFNKRNSKSGYFGTELSYELDSLQLISGRFNINGEESKSFGRLSSVLSGGTLPQQYNLGNESKGNGDGMDASLNYQLAAKSDRNRILTLSYQYSNSDDFMRNTSAFNNRLNYEQPDYKQQNAEKTAEHTFQADYVYPGKKLNVEFGLKGILRNNKSDFKYFSLNSFHDQFELDPNASSKFDYDQNVFSAYNSYRYHLNSWDFQAGLRLEQTLINADFLNETARVKQNYTNLFPSLTINKSFKDGSSLNFGYTQRMKRPGINRLNPFIDRTNPEMEVSGNPHLRPGIVNSFAIGYNIYGKVTFNTGIDYSYLRKADLPVTTFDPVLNITRKTFDNSGNIDGLSYFVYVNFPVNNKLNFSVNGNAIYFWISGLDNGKPLKTELFTYAMNLSAGYNFDKGWRANADLNIMSKNPTGFQGTSNGMVSSTLKISKSMMKDKLSFAAALNNPFTKMRNNSTETSGPDFYQTTRVHSYFRSFSLGLNYNFGGLKGQLKKNKRGINNDDLQNGKGV